ncbi:Adenosine receptor A1 [Triplophysa tibetana]|uniref:Adenosine receptor A1 n=1 Tax=Triplophysa tibetana TaxID=1572043 RepID=A0A5A9NU72_9TELE|nr:Adenosine receptor A1 [Triplophysa tibetana]
MFAVWRSGALNQSTFCLIVSLAMADFLVGCLAVPLALLEGMKIETSFSSCLFISCVLIVPLQASVLNLLAIAVDRCLRVCIPFRYKSSVNKRHSWSWLLAGVCWMLACLLGFIPMFGCQNTQVSASVMYCGVILSHANSVVNPVVYAFKVPKIRAEFSMIWRQVTGSRQQEDRISRTPEIQTRAGDGNICQVDFNAGK